MSTGDNELRQKIRTRRIGSSSSQEKVIHGANYMEMDNLQSTKIIKTGGGYRESVQQTQMREAL